MKPHSDVGKLLVVLGACAWIGAVAACGGSNSRSVSDSGAGSTGGVLGSGGGTRADAMLGTGGGGGTGGMHTPDAPTSSGGQAGGGTIGSGGVAGGGTSGSGGVVRSGGVIGSGGIVASGGSTGEVDASTRDTGSGGACGTAGATCGPGQFCDLASQCGTIPNPAGTCEDTGPQVACTREYRPVCGCNLVAYDNDCLRRAAGVLKLQEGLCGGPPDGSMGGQPGYDGGLGGGGTTGTGGVSGSGGTTGTTPTLIYTGCFWSGGMDHMTLQKQDLAQDQCIVLQLARPTTSRAGYTVTLPTDWGLVAASISPCTGTGTSVIATSATGTIAWGDETVYPPATADVDVVLGLTLVDGGATVTYVFSARDIALPYGC